MAVNWTGIRIPIDNLAPGDSWRVRRRVLVTEPFRTNLGPLGNHRGPGYPLPHALVEEGKASLLFPTLAGLCSWPPAGAAVPRPVPLGGGSTSL